jgi:hypothetical protein
MRRASHVAAALFLCMFMLAQTAWTKRVTLVIGNSSYEHVTLLPNSANDSAPLEQVLKEVG